MHALVGDLCLGQEFVMWGHQVAIGGRRALETSRAGNMSPPGGQEPGAASARSVGFLIRS